MKKVILITSLLATSACGTLMNGRTQNVVVQSEPAGARLVIDGVDYGKTPVSAELPRQKRLTGLVLKDGYKDDSFLINGKASKWSTYGNIVVFWVLSPVFMLGDMFTGGMYTYKRDTIFVPLEEENKG